MHSFMGKLPSQEAKVEVEGIIKSTGFFQVLPIAN